MSASTTATEDASGTARKRLTPSNIAIGIGIGFALFTLGSGISSAVWHRAEPEDDVRREMFHGVSNALFWLFYIAVPVLIIIGAFLFSNRTRNWERGKPDNRRTTPANVKRRFADFRAGVYMQTLLRDPAAGIMHSLIYFGFMVLLAVTAIGELDHQLPTGLKFLHGTVYQAYSAVGDGAGLVLFVGVMWAIIRRYVQRPYRIRIKTKPEHALALWTILAIGVTGFLAEATRIALVGRPDFEVWSFVGYPLSAPMAGWSNIDGWHTAITCVLPCNICSIAIT